MADLDIQHLPPDQLTDLLAKAGSAHATAERIRADIAAGAPVGPDGTLGLVAYAAWLVKQAGKPDGP